MIKTVIIDDEEDSREISRSVIEQYCPDINIVAEGDSVKSGTDIIMALQPDLVLLDIDMPDGTGIELLSNLPAITFKVIFITGFQEYAIEAFKFSAIDYLLKPINPKGLIEALNKAKTQIDIEKSNIQFKALLNNLDQQKKKVIILQTHEFISAIEVDNIVRCESDAGYTNFFLSDSRKLMTSRGLKQYEEMLQKFNFIRTHQSHLINLAYFDSYLKKDEMILLQNGDQIPLATRKKDALLTRLNNLSSD